MGNQRHEWDKRTDFLGGHGCKQKNEGNIGNFGSDGVASAMGPGQPGPFDVLHLQSQTQNRKDPKERKSKWLTAFGEGRKEKGYDMTESDEQIIEAVKYILNSGDAEIIHTLKVTIPAYLDCIATKMQHTELMGKTDKL